MMSCIGDESRKKLVENIAGAITDRTKAVILNSPCNPTGMILGREILSEIAALAKKHDLWVLSDEVYRTIVFGGECASILEMPGMKQRTILIDSFSKRFSMTGFRVGFVCAPKEIAQAVANLQENVNSCACMFAQYACMAALENCEEAEKEICSVFKRRCEAMTKEIQKSTRLVPA